MSKPIESEISLIRKRSGEMTAFDKNKISNAIYMALSASSTPNRDLAESLASRVVDKLLDQGFTRPQSRTYRIS